jgi:hypothetical protein
MRACNLVTLAAAVFLAGANVVFAAPVLHDDRVNEQLKQIDVAGVRFGDTIEEVHATLRKSGWTNIVNDVTVESFSDTVGRRLSAKTGRPFKPSGKRVPAVEDYRKGNQELQITYMQHPLGTLVYTVTYHHRGITTEGDTREFRRLAGEKFKRTSLVQISQRLLCLPEDGLCAKSVANGGLMSELPSIYIWSLYGMNVSLDGGLAAKKVIARVLEDAVGAGPLETSF